MRAPLGAADERPPSTPPPPAQPTQPPSSCHPFCSPPLLLPSPSSPPLPPLPSPLSEASPRPRRPPPPSASSVPSLLITLTRRPSWLMTGGVPAGHRRRGAACRVAHRGGGGGDAPLASRAVRTARQEMHEIHTRALEIGSRLAPPLAPRPYPAHPSRPPTGRPTDAGPALPALAPRPLPPLSNLHPRSLGPLPPSPLPPAPSHTLTHPHASELPLTSPHLPLPPLASPCRCSETELSAFLRFARRLAGGQFRNDERFEEQAHGRRAGPLTLPNTPETRRDTPDRRSQLRSSLTSLTDDDAPPPERLPPTLAKYMLLRASQTLDARPAEEAEEQAALPPPQLAPTLALPPTPHPRHARPPPLPPHTTPPPLNPPTPLTPPLPLPPHPSPSPLAPRPSPLAPHPSPLTPHPSPLTPHPSPLTPRPP